MARRKHKGLCPYCGSQAGYDEAMVIHCRTHEDLYECTVADRTIFERKSTLAAAIEDAGGIDFLKLFETVDEAYEHVMVFQESKDVGMQMPIRRTALHAYLKERLKKT